MIAKNVLVVEPIIGLSAHHVPKQDTRVTGSACWRRVAEIQPFGFFSDVIIANHMFQFIIED